MSTAVIEKAAELLSKGELVVIPTETVYGLAANAFDPVAVDKIYALKKRPKTNPLILHIKRESELIHYVTDIPEVAKKLISKFWPGPLTLLLPKTEHVPSYITSGSDKVAIRVPRNKKTLALLERIDFPLVAPSANPFTYISPTKPEHLYYCYGDKTPFILEDGECEEGVESTIIGFEKNQIIVYRLGAITTEEIEEVSGQKVIIRNSEKELETTPGMHKKHYSPKTKVEIVDLATILNSNLKHVGVITFTQKLDTEHSYFLGENGINDSISRLYSTMYELDKMDLSKILIERIPEEHMGRTIMDRLRRSAS